MSLTLSLSGLGPLHAAVEETQDSLRQQRVAERIVEHDHTLWKPDPTEISNRLGWMDSPAGMVGRLPEIDNVVNAVRADGMTHALLLGMGGSSLAPEVFRRLFGVAPGYLDLSVLDSTDPAAVSNATGGLDPARTLFVPATKSGGTVETLSFTKYCYGLVVAAVGRQQAGRQFVAITDPGSGLVDLANHLGFRHTFLNDPDIGGRYSALSCFGIFPARLGGVDVRRLLASGDDAAHDITDDGVGVGLGTAIGAAARTGRDKLTLITSPSLSPLGVWIEQLIAESTGKEGKGILPVDGEPLGTPNVYGDDRLFVRVRLVGEPCEDDAVDALVASDEVKRRYLDHANNVGRLYKAVLPDSAAHEVYADCVVIRVLADKIRALSPLVDITGVMQQVENLLDRSIAAEGYVITEAHDPLIDLSKIDFNVLKAQFEQGRKHTETEKVKGAVARRLKQMIRLNRTRMDYMERFQRMIDEYNSGAVNVEEFFRRLLEFAKSLNEEEQRAVWEVLTEEELAVFDLLTKPEMELTAKEREQVKKAAHDLLEKLKQEKLVLDWRKRQQSRAAVRVTIQTVLDDGLPDPYTEEIFARKADAVFHHIYESYYGAGKSVYASVA